MSMSLQLLSARDGVAALCPCGLQTRLCNHAVLPGLDETRGLIVLVRWACRETPECETDQCGSSRRERV